MKQLQRNYKPPSKQGPIVQSPCFKKVGAHTRATYGQSRDTVPWLCSFSGLWGGGPRDHINTRIPQTTSTGVRLILGLTIGTECRILMFIWYMVIFLASQKARILLRTLAQHSSFIETYVDPQYGTTIHDTSTKLPHSMDAGP